MRPYLAEPYATVAKVGMALGCLAGVASLCVVTISARHEQRRAATAICEARWQAMTARNPYLTRYVVQPIDPCERLKAAAR